MAAYMVDPDHRCSPAVLRLALGGRMPDGEATFRCWCDRRWSVEFVNDECLRWVPA